MFKTNIIKHYSANSDWIEKVQEEAERQVQLFMSWVDESETDLQQLEFYDIYQKVFEMCGGYEGNPPGITDDLVRAGLIWAVNMIEMNQITTNMKNTKEAVMLPVGHLTSKKEAEKSEEEQQNIDTYLSAGQPVMLPAPHIQSKSKVKKDAEKKSNPVNHTGTEPVMMGNPIVKKA